MGARDEFQNIVTARNVARRAATSATPIFDKLFKEESKVNVSLGAAEKKLGPLVTKVTDMVKKTYGEGSGIPDLLGSMLDASQKVFGHFREIKDANFEAAKEGRNLFSAVKEMNQAYNALAQVRQDKKGDKAAEVAKDLLEAVSKVKTVYAQYVKAYDTRS
jgi:cold shock CspA family protein